jgi:density-regulated protein DRP1
MYDRLWSEGILISPPGYPQIHDLLSFQMFASSLSSSHSADSKLPDALAAATSSLSLDAQKRAEKDAHKKALKAEAAEAKALQTIASSKVTIKRVERNKRKYVTTVTGLEAFSLENKKVAKDLGKKFATGASVTKVPSGGEEIVVQGDVSEEIEEFLLEKYPVIPEDNIELVEDKKKKGSGAGG